VSRAEGRLAIAALALCAALAACGRGRGGAPSALTTTVDTAGGVVRIANRGPAPRWRLEPLLTLGKRASVAGSSLEEFGKVRGVVADGEGRLYVADGIAHEIRVFGPDGTFLRKIGREGAGPGEFGGIGGLWWLAPDTLVVLDYGNARVAALRADGEEVAVWPWLSLTGTGPFVFEGGPRAVYAHALRGGRDGRTESVWVRFTPGGPRDSLPIPRSEPPPGALVTCRGGNGIGFFGNPFADGLIAVPAPGDERVVARASSYRLAFIDAGGDTLRTVSRDVAAPPVPDSAWSGVMERYRKFRESWKGADCEGGLERPDRAPILRGITFGEGGRVLVERGTAGGRVLDLFGRDLRLEGTVAVPPDGDASVSPYLRGDRLYLVTADGLGVQRVRSYAIADSS